MPDEAERKYLSVGIDRATRRVFMEILVSKTVESVRSFPRNLIEKAPFTIPKALTDNGKEFTDRFRATGQRGPTGKHLFDEECTGHDIVRRLIRPRTLRTNGTVGRFNGGAEEVLERTSSNHPVTLRRL